jgi:CelD/BcsL family acetyltransferase involved in cellulose biosynthesis
VTVQPRELSYLDRPETASYSTIPLQVERLVTARALERLAPEWAALDATLSPRMPFTAPAWNLLWWKNYQRRQLLVDDRLNSYAVRDATGRLIAVAPMMITRRSFSPLRLRELQFFGADTNVTEMRGVITRPEHFPAVIAALQAEFSAHPGGWDWVQWRGLRNLPDTAPWEAQIPGFATVRVVTDYYLNLPATWPVFKSGLSRNIKESLRKCYNSLARDGHEFVFRAVTDPADIAAAIDRFLTLHTRRAELTETITHRNSFTAPQSKSFLHDYALVAAEQQQGCVFELLIGGQVVASRVAMLFGDEMFLYFSGYDPAWRRYSVMTTVLAEALQWAIGRGMRIANLSSGTDVSKTRWRPDSVSYTDGYAVTPGWRSGLAFSVMSRLRAARGRKPGIEQPAAA